MWRIRAQQLPFRLPGSTTLPPIDFHIPRRTNVIEYRAITVAWSRNVISGSCEQRWWTCMTSYTQTTPYSYGLLRELGRLSSFARFRPHTGSPSKHSRTGCTSPRLEQAGPYRHGEDPTRMTRPSN
ncbi:hypothetical protein EJ04DRAFT_193635 [Polyplosphaeria fusca]|uniref:Uncharacterized protein n=1 Tax=Polyplosphaeria fusca TaxID=682080 RepID=A0A9P4QXD9_9PLEO|nr:hypothetical protein EJ04DRAFT_193635 [Polyplosphaeria fusca]